MLSLVDNKTDYLINGYIHDIENKYKLSTNIALSIIQICILFYYQFEYFSKCGKDLVIKGEQKNTIKKIQNDYSWRNAAYGTKWIESTSSSIVMEI